MKPPDPHYRHRFHAEIISHAVWLNHVFTLRKQLALPPPHGFAAYRHDHARNILKAFQQPAKEALRGVGIPPWLNEDVEHDAVLIDRSPKIMPHALDPDEHLIKVPLVTGSWSAAAQVIGKALCEFFTPAPNGLTGDNNAPLGQK